MSTQIEAENQIKKFIEKDNGFDLKELVLELLGENWEDEIHYWTSTALALTGFLIDPKINKKFYEINPTLNITTGPNLVKLVEFFTQLQTADKAKAEIELEHMQQRGTTLSEKDFSEIANRYSKK
jgi:hypothetical protein